MPGQEVSRDETERLHGTTAGTKHSRQWKVNGTVTLEGGSLVLGGDYQPASGDSIVIISNDGTDSVHGTIEDLPERSELQIGGRQLNITYTGGDGNDVALISN